MFSSLPPSFLSFSLFFLFPCCYLCLFFSWYIPTEYLLDLKACLKADYENKSQGLSMIFFNGSEAENYLSAGSTCLLRGASETKSNSCEMYSPLLSYLQDYLPIQPWLISPWILMECVQQAEHSLECIHWIISFSLSPPPPPTRFRTLIFKK